MEANRTRMARVVVVTTIALLAVGAGAWQAKSKTLTKNQRRADLNARALATAVQARGITNGAYDNNLAGYAKDFGGSLPVNPCTGTRTGYGVTIKGKTAKVFAIKGKLCGDWTPTAYSLSL